MIQRRWISCREASEYLGLHIKTIYRLCYLRKIPFAKVPGIGVRVDKNKLDELLKTSEVIPKDHHRIFESSIGDKP